MPELLSEAWLDLQQRATAELPERPGATACIQYDLTGGPDGPATFHLVVEDGRIASAAGGAADEADFVLIMGWNDFVDSLRGDFDPTVGFMQGRVKVTGNIGRMLSVLPVTTSSEWKAALATVAEQTDDIV